MKLVTYYGKPSYFITMTTNPYWEDVKPQLKSYQTPNDRPDITVRVFNLKLVSSIILKIY